MAYKKQSKKRKTPLKGYTQFQKSKADVFLSQDEAIAAGKAGRDPNDNALGQTIAAGGSILGDTLEDVGFDDYLRGKVKGKGENATSPAAAVDDSKAKAAKAFAGGADISAISPTGNNSKAYEARFGDKTGSVEVGEHGADLGAYGQDQVAAQGYSGGRAPVQTEQSGGGTPPPVEQSLYGAPDPNRPPPGKTGYGESSPYFRMSPFKRVGALRRSPLYVTKGRTMGDLAQSSLTGVEYLGDIGKAGAQGYNAQIDRANYKQLVREDKAKELDEEFGSLEVAPSGNKAYDASVETLARGWKQEFVEAKKAFRSGDMSPEDWISAKHRIQSNAKNYGAASTNLQESLKNWQENKDNVSNSTKPEIIDFFNTMELNPDALTVEDVNGVSTFVGTTNAGKEISIPVDKIANGQAPFRFNDKFDVAKATGGIVTGLAKFKTDIETEFGLGTGTLPFDSETVQNKVNEQVDGLVKNDAQLRAIAAEEFGWDYDEFEEELASYGGVEEGMKAIRDEVKGELKKDIGNQYQEIENTKKFKDDIAAKKIANEQADLNLQQDKAGQGAGGKGLTANAQQNLAIKQAANKEIENKISQGASSNYSNMVGYKGIEKIKFDKANIWGKDMYDVYIKGQKTSVPSDEIENYLKNVSGYTNIYGGGQPQAGSDPSNPLDLD